MRPTAGAGKPMPARLPFADFHAVCRGTGCELPAPPVPAAVVRGGVPRAVPPVARPVVAHAGSAGPASARRGSARWGAVIRGLPPLQALPRPGHTTCATGSAQYPRWLGISGSAKYLPVYRRPELAGIRDDTSRCRCCLCVLDRSNAVVFRKRDCFFAQPRNEKISRSACRCHPVSAQQDCDVCQTPRLPLLHPPQ